MKKLSLLFILLIFYSCSNADVYEHKANLSAISEQIPQMNSIKCKFKQEKSFQNIQKPLISSGDFEFVKGEGVYFYTNYPIKSKIDYTNKNYKQINDIINAISNKKYSKLENEFNFYYEGNINKWIFGLKPKDINVSKYLSEITVKGTDYINEIKIIQTNGNKTTLWFTREDL